MVQMKVGSDGGLAGVCALSSWAGSLSSMGGRSLTALSICFAVGVLGLDKLAEGEEEVAVDLTGDLERRGLGDLGVEVRGVPGVDELVEEGVDLVGVLMRRGMVGDLKEERSTVGMDKDRYFDSTIG